MTQGLISVIENNKVKFKMVCGSDGYFINDVPLNKIRACNTAEELYELCLSHDCGSKESLVVSYMDENNKVQHYHETDDLDHDTVPWYWDQFLNPEFNPRWRHGTCAHTRIVKR